LRRTDPNLRTTALPPKKQHPTMSAPSSLTHSEVQTLLSSSAYDPSVIPKLETYVRSQVMAVASTLIASESPDVRYSFDANRTLIKLYQFFPHLEGGNVIDVTGLAYFLSLLHFPSTDFVALCCLVPERVQSTEPCATLVHCANLLESCDFALFWPEFRKLGIPEYGISEIGGAVGDDRRLLSNAVNGPIASNTLRTNVVRMLARTYRTAPLSMVLGALDLKDANSLMEFGSNVYFLSEGGGTEGEDGTTTNTPIVEGVEGDVVTFALTSDNTKRVGSAYKGGVSYDDVATMMSKSALRGQ
jgi:translation initiation factor 3 subunit K